MASSEGYSPPLQEDAIIKPPPVPNKFTKEELAVLKECNSESLIYRCIPLGILFMGVTNTLVKRGYLPPHPKYGALLKNSAAVFFAYVIGKLSYQGTCREKIINQIPDSRLAQAFSGKRNVQMMAIDTTAEETRDDSLLGQTPSYDLDTNRSSLETAKGLDDNFRPTMDREVRESRREEDQQSFQFTSYDDLRQQNRKAYDKPSTPPQREKPLDNIPRRRPEPTPWISKDSATGKKKNAYGDEWDE